MNILLPSYILAPLILILIYGLITALVFGIKTIRFLFFDKYFNSKPHKTKSKRQSLPEKSIEINPDEVDKIYVKRIS